MPTAKKITQYEGIPSTVLNLMPNQMPPAYEVKNSNFNKNETEDFDVFFNYFY